MEEIYDKLLTKDDLAKRWQLGKRAIENYISEGIIVPIKDIKVVRFNPRYIEMIEGNLPERTTRREKQLERRIVGLEEENRKLKEAIANIFSQCSVLVYNDKK